MEENSRLHLNPLPSTPPACLQAVSIFILHMHHDFIFNWQGHKFLSHSSAQLFEIYLRPVLRVELYSVTGIGKRRTPFPQKKEPNLKKAFENKTKDISEATVPGIYTSGHCYRWPVGDVFAV